MCATLLEVELCVNILSIMKPCADCLFVVGVAVACAIVTTDLGTPT